MWTNFQKESPFGDSFVVQWLPVGCKVVVWPLHTVPQRFFYSSPILWSGNRGEGDRKDLTRSIIVFPVGSLVNEPGRTSRNALLMSADRSAPWRIAAMSERLYSGLRTRALFSPRARMPSDSNFCARSVNRFRGIQNFFSMSSRLKLWNSKRWSRISTIGIPSRVSPVGVAFACLATNIWTIWYILRRLKRIPNERTVFAKA